MNEKKTNFGNGGGSSSMEWMIKKLILALEVAAVAWIEQSLWKIVQHQPGKNNEVLSHSSKSAFH